MSLIRPFKDLQLHGVWQQGSAQLRHDLLAFWSLNGALPANTETWLRTFQVACVARAADGQLVGVASVYPDSLADGSTYWFYRTFIRPDYRNPGLAPRLFALAFEQLAALHADEPQAPVGVIVVTENPKLEAPGGVRLIERLGLQRLGQDVEGRSVWYRRFTEARP